MLVTIDFNPFTISLPKVFCTFLPMSSKPVALSIASWRPALIDSAILPNASWIRRAFSCSLSACSLAFLKSSPTAISINI